MTCSVKLTPGRRSLSLHAEKVSYMYQSENKHENYENHLIHGFVNLSIGKQNMKKFEEYHFLIQKAERLRPKSLFRKNMMFSFCIIFLKNLSRVMRHTKKGKIQGKIVEKVLTQAGFRGVPKEADWQKCSPRANARVKQTVNEEIYNLLKKREIILVKQEQ